MIQLDAADFWFYVDNKTDPDGCWLWLGNIHANGYGRYHGQYAHRIAFELVNGPLEPGLFTCHHCDNPPCCRPDHLFKGTALDNIRDCIAKGRFRGGGGAKTHCKRGHEYTPENSYVNKKGCKNCRTCHRIRENSRYDVARMNRLSVITNGVPMDDATTTELETQKSPGQ
jgi:hypothetical protein